MLLLLYFIASYAGFYYCSIHISALYSISFASNSSISFINQKFSSSGCILVWSNKKTLNLKIEISMQPNINVLLFQINFQLTKPASISLAVSIRKSTLKSIIYNLFLPFYSLLFMFETQFEWIIFFFFCVFFFARISRLLLIPDILVIYMDCFSKTHILVHFIMMLN